VARGQRSQQVGTRDRGATGRDPLDLPWRPEARGSLSYELLLEPIPFPPKPLDPPEETLVPREPDDTEPALRLDTLEVLLGTELVLLPSELWLTAPATTAALAVAALTRKLASEADLLVAATPPPVPPDWPETAERDACNAVARASA